MERRVGICRVVVTDVARAARDLGSLGSFSEVLGAGLGPWRGVVHSRSRRNARNDLEQDKDREVLVNGQVNQRDDQVGDVTTQGLDLLRQRGVVFWGDVVIPVDPMEVRLPDTHQAPCNHPRQHRLVHPSGIDSGNSFGGNEPSGKKQLAATATPQDAKDDGRPVVLRAIEPNGKANPQDAVGHEDEAEAQRGVGNPRSVVEMGLSPQR